MMRGSTQWDQMHIIPLLWFLVCLSACGQDKPNIVFPPPREEIPLGSEWLKVDGPFNAPRFRTGLVARNSAFYLSVTSTRNKDNETYLLRSLDRGTTWEKSRFPLAFYSLRESATSDVMLGWGTPVMLSPPLQTVATLSSDGGEHWRAIAKPTHNSRYAYIVDLVDAPDRLLAVTIDTDECCGTVSYSRPLLSALQFGEPRWKTVDVLPARYSFGTGSANTSVMFEVGGSSPIRVSTGSREDWKQLRVSGVSSIYSARVSSKELIHLLGKDQKGSMFLVLTPMGIEQWRFWFKSEPLWKLSFYSDEIGFALGSSKAFKTSDGGKSWNPSPIPIDEKTDTLSGVWMFEPLEGIALIQKSGEPRFFKTRDGGATWVPHPTSWTQ